MINEPLLIILVSLKIPVFESAIAAEANTHTLEHTHMTEYHIIIITNDIHMMLHRMEPILILLISSSDPFTPCYCQINCDN